MVFWTIATWVITPTMIHFYGFNGVSIASAIIALSFVGVVMLVKRFIAFSIFKIILYPLIATICMGIALSVFGNYFITSYLTIFIGIVIGALVYFAVMYLLASAMIRADIQMIKENLKK